MTASLDNAPQLSSQALVDRPDVPHQSIYADQVSSVALGAFTARFTLAVEDHNLHARVPAVTVVMPTDQMLAFAQTLIAALTSKDSVDEVQRRHQAYDVKVRGSGQA